MVSADPPVSTGRDGLRKVYVEPTNACNRSCTTCVRHAWDEPEGFMERATFAAVVEGLAAARSAVRGEAAGDDGAVQPAGTVAFMGLGEPPVHTCRCFALGRRVKVMTRWEVGRLPDEHLAAVLAKPDYAAFRERVRRFDFPPCTDWDCELAAGNLEDCLGDSHPVCGDPVAARADGRVTEGGACLV